MIIVIGLLLCYTCCLLLYKPAPESLKAEAISYSQNAKSIKATIVSGIVLILIFGITTEFRGIALTEQFHVLTASKSVENPLLLPIQLVTNHFIHLNIVHLVSNIFILMLLSTYERRVGSKRFLVVLAIATAGSTGSLLFLPEEMFTCGFSGGILGLAAAFFTDYPKNSGKKWLLSTAAFLVLFALFSIQGEHHYSEMETDMQTDHMGHILGALSALLYCRFVPIKTVVQRRD